MSTCDQESMVLGDHVEHSAYQRSSSSCYNVTDWPTIDVCIIVNILLIYVFSYRYIIMYISIFIIRASLMFQI